MNGAPDFVTAFKEQAAALQESVFDLTFSRGTYNCEVREKKKSYFPFLQLSDSGNVRDCFCSCAVSEAGKGCPHLAAAYLKIFNHKSEPLHVRFSHSFWNCLFEEIAKRQGYSPQLIIKSKEGVYSCLSKTKKELFSIQSRNAKTQQKLVAIFENRVVETEETSIKFSNRSLEEIAEYRAGRGSHELCYDLSPWSDLAKWIFLLQEEGVPYSISFTEEHNTLPHRIGMQWSHFELSVYVSDVMWPSIIPSLNTIASPLQIFEKSAEQIESIRYDHASRSLIIAHRHLDVTAPHVKGFDIGQWRYIPGKGFAKNASDPLFQQDVIREEQIAETLSVHAETIGRFLLVHPEPRTAKYSLRFDAVHDLLVELYLEHPGDLNRENAALFGSWLFVLNQGFFLLSDLMFLEICKRIVRKEVAEFVSKHRVWLHHFPTFQTHLGHLEAHLTYTLNDEGTLSFDAALNFPEQFDEMFDFGEWVYIKGSGFYMKKESRGNLPLHRGLVLQKSEIASFIVAHQEELEQVNGFFAPHPLVIRSGLDIAINQEGQIAISPHIEYIPTIDPKEVQIFGDFVYAKGVGFSELGASFRLPEHYREKRTIPTIQEVAFLTYELEPLRSFIFSLDPKLQKSQNLKLKVRRIQRAPRRKGREWLVDLIYESESGFVNIFPIWDAFQSRKRHLFSDAGLLQLKEARFNWLRQLSKKRLHREKGMVRLNTLEWIRLSVFEDVKEPKGVDSESEETRKLLQELQRFEASRLIDISMLQSQLRPYQETGVQWLWFLYCHGLSGLLCDDMGLGKTHQAMALLAAVQHEDEDRNNKYLVVCPTSVIYHWEDLLRRFLPHLRVCTYYGIERSLESFAEQYDLVLTSYGILRTGKNELHTLSFEVAIFDEIQIAKNSASQTHEALISIDAQMRLGLTGTPIENRIRELKSLFDIVLPGYMPIDPIFRELFVNPIEKAQDGEAKALLSKLVKPFMLRRKKSEVLLDLPEKIEEISYCDLSDEQKLLYRETAESFRSTVYVELKDASKPISYIHVFAALTRLKQICDHPCLISGEVKQYRDHRSGKWDLFTELLDEARDSGQKVVVFSQYLDMLAIIEAHLKKKGIGYASIKGATRDRSEQIRRFREDPSCEIFVASLLAAGVGIDLTTASIVIHYDRWWNPAKENQATDRVHRIGQNRGVQVFKLVTKNTVEEHIHNLIERKKGLMEEIVGQDEADQINYLSREELLQIFSKITES